MKQSVIQAECSGGVGYTAGSGGNEEGSGGCEKGNAGVKRKWFE